MSTLHRGKRSRSRQRRERLHLRITPVARGEHRGELIPENGEERGVEHVRQLVTECYKLVRVSGFIIVMSGMKFTNCSTGTDSRVAGRESVHSTPQLSDPPTTSSPHLRST